MKFLIRNLFLFGIIMYSDAAYSRYTSSSRFQPNSIPTCNNSQSRMNSSPQAQPLVYSGNTYKYPTKGYLNPTILNDNPIGNTVDQEAEVDRLDIGNRIDMPLSSSFTPGNSWIPHRLVVQNTWPRNQNSLTWERDQKRILDVENGIRFYLFTKENPTTMHELRMYLKSTLDTSKFNASNPTKVILHGFTDVGVRGEWINTMKEAYISTSDVNLIVVDYSSFSVPNLLRTNLPILASRRLADLVIYLEKETGAGRETFHVIARAWACHVAGMSGKLLGGKLGRISGLEPAEKLAIKGFPDSKLDRKDAQFVDITHVNGQRFFFHAPRFGLLAPTGHVDIYPNIAEKGLGCPGENPFFQRYSARYCQLGRGVKYFTESIKHPETHPMCLCESFDLYKAGQCSCSKKNADIFLGEHLLNETRGIFQLAPLLPNNPDSRYIQFSDRPVYT